VSKNQTYQVREEPKIVIQCEKCQQKLLIPQRTVRLCITCPTCRHEFNYPQGDEFRLITPKELKRLIVGVAMVVLGLVLLFVMDSLPSQELTATFVFILLFLAVAPVGMVLLVLFGIIVLIERNDIARFRPIGRIFISRHGIALYRKDGSAGSLIGWRRIKAIRVRYLKRMFSGLIEPGQEPAAIEFDFVDGSAFRIPLFIVLKGRDRLRLVYALSRYASFQTMA